MTQSLVSPSLIKTTKLMMEPSYRSIIKVWTPETEAELWRRFMYRHRRFTFRHRRFMCRHRRWRLCPFYRHDYVLRRLRQLVAHALSSPFNASSLAVSFWASTRREEQWSSYRLWLWPLRKRSSLVVTLSISLSWVYISFQSFPLLRFLFRNCLKNLQTIGSILGF